MRDPDRQEVLDAIDQGIRKAQEDYRKAFMSHIRWAPEYLMTVNIFQSILALKDKCGCTYGLSLEEPVRELLPKDSLSQSSRDPRENGYCDLSLRDIEDKPRAIIEVKRYAWNYWEDLVRLKYLLERGLKFGVFASCLFAKVEDNDEKEAGDRLEEEIKCLKEHISDDNRKSGGNFSIELELGTVDRLLLEGEKPDQNQEWKWCSVCFVISQEA